MKQRFIFALVLIIVVCGFMIGCGKNDDSGAEPNNSGTQNPPSEQPQQPTPPAEQPKPVESGYTGGKAELTLFDHNTKLTDEEFQEYYGKLLKAKYPDITVTKVTGNIKELVAGGSTPDLVTASNAVIDQYLDVDYPYDLTEMVKKYNFDLSILQPELVKALKNFDSAGSLVGLPFANNSSALLYNQDIFDKFGLEFPNKDIITLEEYAELVKMLTRLEDGVQYIGGNLQEVNIMGSSGLPMTDPNDKNKIVVSTDKHKYVWALLEKIYHLPNYIGADGKHRLGAELFWKEQIMALNWTWLDNTLGDATNSKATFKWDIHSQPVIWKDTPTANALDFHLLMVSNVSKNKDAAFAVVSSILSKETQTVLNRRGRLSSYADPAMKSEYAKDSGVFEGKNLKNVFLFGPTPLPDNMEHLIQWRTALKETAIGIAVHKIDINTALRLGEEKANQEVKEKLAAEGNK